MPTLDPADLSFEYFRPFYPLNQKQVRKSPLGRTIVWSISYEDDLKIEDLLEEIRVKLGIAYKIRLTSTPYTKDVYSQQSEGVELHDDVYNELRDYDSKLKSKGRPLKPIQGGFVSTAWVLLLRINGEVEWLEYAANDIIEYLSRVTRYGVEFVTDCLNMPDAKKKYPLL